MNLQTRSTSWLMALWLCAAAGGPAAAADGPPYTRTRDVVYGRKAGLALTMDVFRPKGKANGAAVLWLNSGDWMSDMGQFADPRPLSADYLGRGYTVIVVGHSSFPAFSPDEIVPDIHRAVRYVRHHARELGVDADRLAIIGTSSGGHLAAHVGVSGGQGPPFPAPDLTGLGRYDPVEQEPSQVAAFVSFCGPTDLLNYEAEGKSFLDFRLPEEVRKKAKLEHFPLVFREFHRKSLSYSAVTDKEQIRRKLKALSPASLVSAESAPGLLIYGEKDANVPVRQAEILAGRMKAAGVPVELIVRKGVGHDVAQAGDGKLVADWLDKRLGRPKAGAK
ncbi:MAG TPA: alpha/beta hydrolase [Gemmataceae bacterium]|nr:alpha/beta hydrolase [Gemmataceae bacterium]